jgi:hypothetical protein
MALMTNTVVALRDEFRRRFNDSTLTGTNLEQQLGTHPLQAVVNS